MTQTTSPRYGVREDEKADAPHPLPEVKGNGSPIPMTTDFEVFWTVYPRRQARKDALKAWGQVKPSLDLILKALDWQRRSRQWRDGFIPLPATYLRGERWTDEPEPEPINGKHHPAERPSITCESCGHKVFSWTGRKCDSCWRSSQGMSA